MVNRGHIFQRSQDIFQVSWSIFEDQIFIIKISRLFKIGGSSFRDRFFFFCDLIDFFSIKAIFIFVVHFSKLPIRPTLFTFSLSPTFTGFDQDSTKSSLSPSKKKLPIFTQRSRKAQNQRNWRR